MYRYIKKFSFTNKLTKFFNFLSFNNFINFNILSNNISRQNNNINYIFRRKVKRKRNFDFKIFNTLTQQDPIKLALSKKKIIFSKNKRKKFFKKVRSFFSRKNKKKSFKKVRNFFSKKSKKKSPKKLLSFFSSNYKRGSFKKARMHFDNKITKIFRIKKRNMKIFLQNKISQFFKVKYQKFSFGKNLQYKLF
jgi:hypothetical protein